MDTSKLKIELCQMATLSTCHITETDALLLQEDCTALIPRVTVYELGEYGWLVWVEQDEDAMPAGYSEEFLKLFKLAKEFNAAYIRLDRDADQIEGLAKFDW